MASSHNSHATPAGEASLVRPTEAQLRWAQFHHKRRAVGVRASVRALHLSPATWEQVPGSVPEDGNSSSSCSDITLKEIRKRRLPPISQGRRALLRVSRRAYQRRRQVILQEGYIGTTLFSGGNSDTDGSSSQNENIRHYEEKDKKMHQKRDDAESDVHEDTLNEIFMIQSSRRRRKKRGKHAKRSQQRDESFKRFQAACHAMMMNLTAPPKHSIVIPTRKWTRTVDPAAALDDEYLDPKWGIRRRPDHGADASLQAATSYGAIRHLVPMDRAASWMMHLPKGISTARENPYYHNPSLAIPPSAGSYTGSDSQESSVASTLALQAPGEDKFKMLVALVQQRMIQRHHEEKIEFHDNDPPPHIQDPEISEFHTYRSTNGLEAAYPLHSTAKKTIRRSHYVPRMRLRDFAPAGTSVAEVEDVERNPVDGEDHSIPPKMKLRGFPCVQNSQLPVSRRKSRTQELVESYEPPKKNKDRGLSKTRQMAQSLEGTNPKHPRMRLRTHFELSNVDIEEKKFSNDGAAPVGPARSETQQKILSGLFDNICEEDSGHNLNHRPVRHPHALSGRFSAATSTKEQNQSKLKAPISAHSPPQHEISQGVDTQRSEGDDSSGPLQAPPQRKPHPMSHRFVQAMQASQQSPHKARIVVNQLPPGTCCSRCTKPSPVARNNQHAFTCSESENYGSERNYAKLSAGSARVSDFFSQLRLGIDASTLGTATVEKTSTRASSTADEITSTSGTQRVSDFFAKVRQLNPTTAHNPSQSTLETDDLPVEGKEFFAQVREMIATSDDDEESASQRVSDFFAQVRKMTIEMEEENLIHPLCEECQIEDIEDRIESASVTLSPEHGAVRSESTGAARSANAKMGTGKTASFDEDEKSEHSVISGLLNRGRTSLHSFASSLNAISEKTANVTAIPTSQGRISATNMPGRVGSLLQRLHGQKEQEKQQDQLPNVIEDTEPIQSLQIDGGEVNDDLNVPIQPGLDYYEGNDLEAMAAYRRSQEMKRLSSNDDDTSSHSSFHVLPEGIREVVKRKGSSSRKNPRELSTSKEPPPEASGLSFVKDVMPNNGMYPSPTNPIKRTFEKGGLDADLAVSGLLEPSTTSPSRVARTSSSHEDLSPEKYREVHGKILFNSPLLNNIEQGIIDTDGTTSDASNSGMNPEILASMMLSPDLLQKRLHQAVRAVEGRRWDQVEYLLNANPWLAEMCELTSNQYLLHKIAFFGVSAPRSLCEHLIERFPSAIYKFDHDGNVPLHLAAAAGHMAMILMLGEKFQSGASIRNEDGMLPLHFAIASYADYEGQAKDIDDEKNLNPLSVIKTVLKFFPQAVAIGDNDGNLPIHVAAECLKGGFGVDVIYMLLDEADRQLQDPDGARFYNKGKLKDIVLDDISSSTMPPDGDIDSEANDETHCVMVKNDFGETPVLAAVRHRRGWDIIEALVSGPGGQSAALYEDADKNNILHLLVGEYQDPAAAVSILKIVPKTATMRNSQGMLPIEVACLQLMPDEVILAMALVDLPFDIDDRDSVRLRQDHGGSWWFLTCECDDHYVHVVQQISMICTFQQIRELCFAQRGSSKQKESVISRATPKCKVVLSHALRFLGRFEFLGDTPLEVDSAAGLKVFDALDFADAEGFEEGRRVLLKCYSIMDAFVQATTVIREIPLDPSYVEEIVITGDHDGRVAGHRQFCIAIECPQVTLNRVVDGMTKKAGYQYDTELRKKYAAKMCAVLRLIAKAIRHLHECGVVHGNICLENCGKFDHTWKLLDIMGSQRTGAAMRPSRYQRSFPPEVLQLDEHEGAICDSDNTAVSFQALIASPSIDIWAFGKLAYEALVGKPLVDFDASKLPIEDVVSLLQILEWNQSNMKAVFTELLDIGVTDSCAELITSCLFPHPEDRPVSMDVILQDPFWKDMRQYRERSSPSKRSRNDATRSDDSSSPTKSIFTDTASAVDTSLEVGSTAEI